MRRFKMLVFSEPFAGRDEEFDEWYTGRHLDDRAALRRFFETDTGHVVVAVLSKLADAGEIEPKVVQSAIERFGIDVERTAPWVD